MSDVSIQLTEVSKYYKLYQDPRDRLKEALHPFRREYHNKHFALDRIDLKIGTGEIVGIVGRNGSGKSTLLKLIAGVLQPSEGTIQVNGRVTALLELGSGFNPEFSGLDNISFYANVLGIEPNRLKQILPDILDFAGLGDYIQQPLKSYSSGMKARLGFSVAVHVEPEILILDEVLAVGDALFKRKCYSKMDEFFRSGKTILYVSHDANSINRLCSRAILIDRGRVLMDGDAREVTKQYDKLLFAKSGADILQIDSPVAKKSETGETDQLERAAHTPPSQTHSYEPYFVPNFLPKTRVVYPSDDVTIDDVSITTISGKKVNVLITGEEYIYRYRVRFLADYENISFGMRFLTEQGVQITGASGIYNDRIINKIHAPAEYEVKWRFKCNLLAGVYFTNAGISEHTTDEIVMVARHVDAMVFKVITPKDVIDMSRVYLQLDLDYALVTN